MAMHLLSEHFRNDHSFFRIDARVKLVFALALLAMVLSYKGFFFPLLVLFCSIACCVYIKVPARAFFLRFAEPLFIAAVIVLLKLFFSGNDVLFSISLPTSHFSLITLTGYSDGLKEGLLIACRILGAVSVLTLLGLSTPFTELIAGLAWLRFPKGFIEVLMFAYRYIFLLFEDAMVIYNSQKNRLGYASVKQGLSSFGTLAGSLTLKAFENSQNTALAMTQRGYDGSMPMLKHKPFNPPEVVVSFFLICVMGVLWQI
ncbi:MAG: cobalt ECF transporter T component CbiQ [Nitrospirae bacterium]|nr:MAG: cobalt ECF transporter T component CbiQ [Nitrospirota bacterium]